MTAFYRATWAGLPAAQVVMSFTRDGARYRDALRINTVGPARWLTHFHAHVSAEGSYTADGTPRPARYDTLYDSHGRHDQRQRLEFVSRDGALIAERGFGDSTRKPPLPEIARRDVVDPLSALGGIRAHLRRDGVTVGEHFAFAVFDDDHRYNVAVRVVSAGGHGKPIRLHLAVRTITGFHGNTLDGGKSDGKPQTIEFLLSDDGRLLPLSIRATVAWLPLVVDFDHLCADLAHCGRRRR